MILVIVILSLYAVENWRDSDDLWQIATLYFFEYVIDLLF